MIELTKLTNEVESKWPMAQEGTSDKWKVVKLTHDLLTKVISLRPHSPEELKFIDSYYDAVNSVDPIILHNVEIGFYDTAFLPYEFAAKLNKVYESINHH